MIATCPHCQAVVDAVELKKHYTSEGSEPTFRYTFGHCPRCRAPILTAATDEGSDDYGEERQLFPSLDIHTPENLPRSVESAYVEAQKCFRSGALTAAAIMCRKTVESVCAEHGVRERGLAMSLDKMREKGLIERELYDWATMLRLEGNEAAHAVGANTTPESATDVMDFTAALVEYLFTFRERFKQYKTRSARNSVVNEGLQSRK